MKGVKGIRRTDSPQLSGYTPCNPTWDVKPLYMYIYNVQSGGHDSKWTCNSLAHSATSLWFFIWSLSINIWKWLSGPTSSIASVKANYSLWFMQCLTMRSRYFFTNIFATPDFFPSITLTPSLPNTTKFVKYSSSNPCFPKNSLLQSQRFGQTAQQDWEIKNVEGPL